MVRSSHHLMQFAHEVVARWNPVWGPTGTVDDLSRCLGDALVTFLQEQGSAPYVVPKTPSVEQLHNFPRLFPTAKLIILVRDGRAVAASGMQSFDWDFESAVRQWDHAAHEIISFKTAYAETWPNFLIVRYEDIVNDTRGELRRIFRFLGLDEEKYDFDGAAKLPVRGSSELRSKHRQDIHWEPISRAADFDPLRRGEDLTAFERERFEWITGERLRFFGYAVPAPRRHLSRVALRHASLDGRIFVQRVVHGVAHRIGLMFAPISWQRGIRV